MREMHQYKQSDKVVNKIKIESKSTSSVIDDYSLKSTILFLNIESNIRFGLQFTRIILKSSLQMFIEHIV